MLFAESRNKSNFLSLSAALDFSLYFLTGPFPFLPRLSSLPPPFVGYVWSGNSTVVCVWQQRPRYGGGGGGRGAP